MASNAMTVLMEAPSNFSKFLDACTCGRADKAAVAAIRKELEQKDGTIERLEEEIRRKDTEKDNLIHMQKDLQSQIEEIRLMLEAHATEAKETLSDEKAIVQLQSRARGRLQRKQVEKRAEAGILPGQERQMREKSILKMQAKARGRSARRLVAERQEAGLLPGQQRVAGSSSAGDAQSYNEDLESVDSDYDYDDAAFDGLGTELFAGKLKLAKVYGQVEAPAAEDELEWEVRHFVLYDTQRILHYDDLVDGVPEGDRGLIDLSMIRQVERVPGVATFVLKCKQSDPDEAAQGKVYLLKMEPHDEEVMGTWIHTISTQLEAAAYSAQLEAAAK